MKETETNVFQQRNNTQRFVMACAATVFLTFSYAHQVAAQTWWKHNGMAQASAQTGGSKGTSASVPASISQLTPKTIDYAHYRNYVTTGQPYDDLSKVMVLYNVGTGKFLSLGGYWGTHAALNDVPRLFWLQRKNDKVADNLYSYVRYTESDDEGVTDQYTNPMASFVKHTSLQVGSQQGSVRTQATYNEVALHHASVLGDGNNVLKPNTALAGRAFMQEYEGSLAEKVVVANLDLSTCASGQTENILSIGTDISQATGNNIHVYYDGANIIAKCQADGASQVTGSVAASGKVVVRLHKNGLYVGGQRVAGFDASNAVVSALATSATAIQVGSTVGDARSNATYESLAINEMETKVLDGYYKNDGKKFVKYYPGSLNDYTLEADIDLADSKQQYNQWGTPTFDNILSIGTNISTWGNDGTDYNVHIAYAPTSGCVMVYTGAPETDGKASNAKSLWWWEGEAHVIHVKLDKNGLTVYPKTNASHNITIPATDATISKLIDASVTTELQIGSMEENAYHSRSNALYESVTMTKSATSGETQGDIDAVTEEVGTSGNTAVVADNYNANGYNFGKYFSGNLGEMTLYAEIDLNKCESIEQGGENVLSIGNGIKQWGNGKYNVHFYYTKYTGEDTFVKYYMVGAAGGSLSYRSINLGSDKVLKVKVENGKLYAMNYNSADGTSSYIELTDQNDVLATLLASGTTRIEVGSMEGSGRSHAVYKKLTVEKASAKAGKVRARAMKTVKKTGNNVGGDDAEVIYQDTPVGGQAVVKTVGAGFENGDYLTAEIDLSSCAKAGENVFSIGTDIQKWGYDEDSANQADNIHIYYLGTENGQYKLYVANANKDHNNDLKRLFYIDEGELMNVELSATGLFINDNEIYTDTDPLPSFDGNKYPGEIVKFKYADADNKIFEIDDEGHYVVVDPTSSDYENAEGIKRGQKSYIYTVEKREGSDVSIPYFITSSFKHTGSVSANEGSFMSWAPRVPNESYGNVGVFGDRALPQGDLTVDEAVTCSEWFFEPVSGKPGTYHVFLNMDNVEVPQRTLSGTTDKDYTYDTVKGTQRFYLQATPRTVYGNNLENYGGGRTDDTASQPNGVEAMHTLPANDAYAEWQVFDLAEYNSLFNASQNEMDGSTVDMSYMLYDPDFRRKNANLDFWKMDDALAGHVRIGYDQFSKKSPTEADYTSDDNQTTGSAQWSVLSNHENNYGRYMGVDVKNASGKFYQTATLISSGWYTLRCGGASTVGSQLFVKLGDNDEVRTPLHQLTEAEYAQLNDINKAWPFDYIATTTPEPMPMYNAIVYMNDDNLSGDDKTIHESFSNNEVKFYIDPDVLKARGGQMTVTLGIDVAPTAATPAQQSAGSNGVATTAATQFSDLQWTVFDNFQLLFSGNTGDPFLVLDEDDETVDHLDLTINKYRSGTIDGKEVNKKLMLHRTFSPGKWNTIMLPVGLTEEQFKNAFGDDAALAELSTLTDKEIQFQTVTAASAYTNTAYGSFDDNTQYWLKPMTPYIIKTGKANGGNTDEYTAKLYTRASNGTEYVEKTVGGQDKPYFIIDNINLVEGIVKTSTTEDTNFGKAWDFKGMTATIGSDTYSYVMTGQNATGNGTMTAYGLLARNFTTATDGTSTLISGRAPMADSYSMGGNKLTYLKAGAKGKAFRCWFQYNEPSDGTSAKPTLMLDGVGMPTGIDDIANNDDGITPIAAYLHGVYTINGQLVRSASNTDGLPKGIYIVDGKKVVKD